MTAACRAAMEALEFLTILRIRPRRATSTPRAFANAAWFYTAVGLLLGAILAAIDRLLREAAPPAVVAVALVAALAVLTGALHLDGLADAFDGLAGGRDREAKLRIMKDVHTGTFGTVAVVLVLLTDALALASLPAGGVRTKVLLLAPAAARAAMLVGMALVPYAREQGSGALVRASSRAPALAGGVAVTLLAGVLLGGGGLAVLAIMAVLGGAFVAWSLVGIGGMTGDCYGAVCELATAGFLGAAAAGVDSGWLEDGLA